MPDIYCNIRLCCYSSRISCRCSIGADVVGYSIDCDVAGVAEGKIECMVAKGDVQGMVGC